MYEYIYNVLILSKSVSLHTLLNFHKCSQQINNFIDWQLM